jgi:hypothetical protein
MDWWTSYFSYFCCFFFMKNWPLTLCRSSLRAHGWFLLGSLLLMISLKGKKSQPKTRLINVDPLGVADQERYSPSINLMMTTFFFLLLFFSTYFKITLLFKYDHHTTAFLVEFIHPSFQEKLDGFSNSSSSFLRPIGITYKSLMYLSSFD